MKKVSDWRLYVITDESLGRGRSHLEQATAAISGGADVIQFREKHAAGKKLYQIAKQMCALSRAKGTVFIVNDRVDIALAVQADGIHVGQEDIPAGIVRRLIGPNRILGVSARTVEEAIQAEKEGADYLGVGPVYEARSTKSDAGEPAGLTLISAIKKQCPLPIIAIGGINLQNLVPVMKVGANGVAVISAIVSSDDILKTSAQFKKKLLTFEVP